jgi:hypothetical protein
MPEILKRSDIFLSAAAYVDINLKELGLGGDGEIRVHFFAGEGAAPNVAGLVRKNRGIVQCAHWTMKLPQAVSIMIRISPSAKRKSTPNGVL